VALAIFFYALAGKDENRLMAEQRFASSRL